MNTLKLLILFVIMLTTSTCSAYQNNQAYPYYQVDYSDIIMKPTYITMPQGNYYNDWILTLIPILKMITQIIIINITIILTILEVLILFIHQVKILPIAFQVVLIVYVIGQAI